MRSLGAEYDARMLTASSQPRLRVTVTDWGGSPDPYDLTPYVAGASVQRALRAGMGDANVEVDDGDGRFDVVAGADRDVLKPNNGTVTIEFGELLPSGETFWTVWTGGIVTRTPRQDATARGFSLAVGPRGNDLEGMNVTTRQYGGEGVTPPTWQANDIVKDLFVGFGAFVDPDDFDLTALDFPISGLQFEGESLWEAAAQCILPPGYRLWFAYDGRLRSGLLIPASWVPVGTVAAIAIAQAEPTDGPPEACRIFVRGGPGAKTAVIHEEQKWAASRYAWDHPSDNKVLGGGDCIGYWLPSYYSARYLMAGPKGQLFRHSEIRNVVLGFCTGGLCPTGGFLTAPHVEEEWWNADEERYECYVHWDCGAYDNLWIDFSFEVWGHPYEWTRPEMGAQAWDDNLIAAWGERQRQIDASAATTYPLAHDVAARELIFAQKSLRQTDVSIKGLDLRIEAGDIWTIQRASGDFDLWVQQLSHAVASDGGQTQLRGYLV